MSGCVWKGGVAGVMPRTMQSCVRAAAAACGRRFIYKFCHAHSIGHPRAHFPIYFRTFFFKASVAIYHLGSDPITSSRTPAFPPDCQSITLPPCPALPPSCPSTSLPCVPVSSCRCCQSDSLWRLSLMLLYFCCCSCFPPPAPCSLLSFPASKLSVQCCSYRFLIVRLK